jgi:dihydroorotate dehydrogenase (fumarate)
VSGGVHDGWSAIKAIWAGASAVEVCTTIFWKGSQRIETMKEQMLQWMTEHGYETIAQFKGHLNMNTSNGASLYKRTQFMKYFSGYRGV